MRRDLGLGVAALVILTGVAGCATGYSVVDVGPYGPPYSGTVEAAVVLNDRCQVVAWSPTTAGGWRVFLWQNGVAKDLGTLGGPSSLGFAINRSAQVAGQSDTATTPHAFRTAANATINPATDDLGVPPGGLASKATGINDFDHVVGHTATVPGERALLWRGGAVSVLQHPTGFTHSLAGGINNFGELVGAAYFAGWSGGHAFLWQDAVTSPLDLGTLPGGSKAGAAAINDFRQVAGSSDVSTVCPGGVCPAFGFIFTLEASGNVVSRVSLGTLPGGVDSSAGAINSYGEVVGKALVNVGGALAERAFLYRGAGITNLNDLVPLGTGWVLTGARSMTDGGQIAGVGTKNGAWRYFLLTPTPAQYAWGRNAFGQLGDGTTTSRTAPFTLGLGAVVSVATGYSHTLALKADGTVWAWGRNDLGELGDGTTTGRTAPVQVKGPGGASVLDRIIAIAAGTDHSLAVREDGTVWAWGYNAWGQLGNGTTTNSTIPVQVSSLSGVGAVAGASQHSLALKSDGTVWAWGWNAVGELGDGTHTNHSTPVQVKGLSTVVAIATGGSHSLAVKRDRTLWTWGFNNYGQLGDGTTTSRNAPVQVKGPGGVGYLTGVSRVAGGHFHSLALTSDRSVWAWGTSLVGQLGNGTIGNTPQTVPIQVTNLTGVAAIAAGAQHSLAVKTDRTLWVWGDDGATQRSTPATVSGLGGLAGVSGGGYYSLAMKPGCQ